MNKPQPTTPEPPEDPEEPEEPGGTEEPRELEAIARLLAPGGTRRGPSTEEGEPSRQPPSRSSASNSGDERGERPDAKQKRRPRSEGSDPDGTRAKSGSASAGEKDAPRASQTRRATERRATGAAPPRKKLAPQGKASVDPAKPAKPRKPAAKAQSPQAPGKVVRKRRRVARKATGQSPVAAPSSQARDTAPKSANTAANTGALPATGHRIAGRFEIAGQLGEGPNGRVFHALDHGHSGRSTALKILHARHARASDFGERLDALFEARSRLRSETINRLRHVGRTDLGLYYLATDPVAGENLRSLLSRRGPLHPRQAFEIVRQVAQGLEEGHAIGLVHGAVHDHNVFLLERIPSSDANPFAVGIRLTDFGLAGLFAEGSNQPSVHDDLRELGWLLVELLSGTRPDPQGRGWEAGTAARLSPEGSTFVARSVGAESPFASAVALREALEALPEWRGDDPTLTRWRRIALGSVVTAVLLTGFHLWSAFRAEGVQAGSTDAPPAASNTEVSRLESELAKVREDLDAARSAALASERAATAERNRSVALQHDLKQAGQEVTRLSELLGTQKVEAETLQASRTELREARALVTELEEELAASREQARKLEEERDAERRARDPQWQAAFGLDRILRALEDRGAAVARAELERTRSSPSFSASGFPGEPFLLSWLMAAEELQSAVEASDPLQAAAHVSAGEMALALAQAELEPFEEDNAAWLSLGEASRTEILRRSLTSLRDYLRDERGYLEPRLSSAWQAVATPALETPPDRVVALARWFDDGRLGPWVDGFAALLLEATDEGKRLDTSALRRLEHLDAWAETLASDPSMASRFSTAEIQLLRYARRFHDPDFIDEAVPPFVVRHQGPGGGSPVSGWRAILELKARLASGEFPYPAPVGTRSVWVTRTPEGDTSYVVETVQRDDAPPQDATRSRIVEQRFYDALGEKRGDRRIRVVQRGKRFFEEGVRQTLLLDLAQESAFEVRYWTPRKEGPTPERLPVHGEATARFHKSLLERGWRTLVRVEGQRAAWFSPELGYVRDAEPGRIERELMLLELPPPSPSESMESTSPIDPTGHAGPAESGRER